MIARGIADLENRFPVGRAIERVVPTVVSNLDSPAAQRFSKGRSRAVREPLQEKCNRYAQGQIQLLSVTRPISRIAVHAVSLALLSVCANLGNRAVADESRVMKTLRKREATPLYL